MFFVDPPFKKPEEAKRPPQPPNEELRRKIAATYASIDENIIRQNLLKRNPYFEIQEAALIENKERKEVHKILGHEIREKCRSEIDDYVDCVVGRLFSIFKCKEKNEILKKCIYKYETPEFVRSRERELMEEREKQGISILRRKDRSKYNRFIENPDTVGWLPQSTVQSEQSFLDNLND